MKALQRAARSLCIRISSFNCRSRRFGRLIVSLHSNPVSVRPVRVHSSASHRPYRLAHAYPLIAVKYSHSSSRPLRALDDRASRFYLFLLGLDLVFVSFLVLTSASGEPGLGSCSEKNQLHHSTHGTAEDMQSLDHFFAFHSSHFGVREGLFLMPSRPLHYPDAGY